MADSRTQQSIGIAGIIKTTINSTILDEIAYIIKKEYQGLGYGTEIVQELVKLAFNRYHLPQIFAQFAIENRASQRILEKNGLTYEFSYQRKQNGMLKEHLVYQLKN
ncbi:GNAT family N-acetyltransferase [Enterococcus hulanensis]|uniref:GNAT family N-acetyltransferase n=1 Tax=Enterococcus hulanensis TaxID=2559929 RepID=UPI00288F6E92|nr:GNAT family N-acetyltransferase [Enterococcus hulanensis]MDT2658406.1 GNAT family N-acetyltransferase [Enterococcus hulanensis]